MTISSVNQSQFQELLNQGKPLVVKFSAQWCQPCKAYAPTVEAVAQNHPDVTFVEVDLDANAELAAQWRIRSIPATIGFKNGALAFQAGGVLSRSALENHVKELS